MLRRLWQILGPVICAALLLVALLAIYPNKLKHSAEEEKNDAVALTHISFKSRAKKIRALSDKSQNFVPFLALVSGIVWTVFIRQCWQKPIIAATRHIC